MKPYIPSAQMWSLHSIRRPFDFTIERSSKKYLVTLWSFEAGRQGEEITPHTHSANSPHPWNRTSDVN